MPKFTDLLPATKSNPRGIGMDWRPLPGLWDDDHDSGDAGDHRSGEVEGRHSVEAQGRHSGEAEDRRSGDAPGDAGDRRFGEAASRRPQSLDDTAISGAPRVDVASFGQVSLRTCVCVAACAGGVFLRTQAV